VARPQGTAGIVVSGSGAKSSIVSSSKTFSNSVSSNNTSFSSKVFSNSIADGKGDGGGRCTLHRLSTAKQRYSIANLTTTSFAERRYAANRVF
jgi:hypothetical protein